MPLHPLSDTSVADWFVDAEADWWTKVCLGPPGHEAYARVHYDLGDRMPDWYNHRLGSYVRDALLHHTSTPNECYFGQWVGSGWKPPIPSMPTIFALTEVFDGGVVASVRDYHLYAGTVADGAAWDELEMDPPHLMWPADHAWFAAKDVDPDWIGVGGTQALIDELVGDARLDVAPTTYDATDWEVR
ncbi:MAG: hypothetical protein JWQ70_2691 [Aeromicrobium sp.]|nr:hypothetical protein [Aeromicrobium sp.]